MRFQADSVSEMLPVLYPDGSPVARAKRVPYDAATAWGRIGTGVSTGLQNQLGVGNGPGGFDSHPLPPAYTWMMLVPDRRGPLCRI